MRCSFSGRRSLPAPTVRLRLTLLYGGMFCVCGAVLLGDHLPARPPFLRARVAGLALRSAGSGAPGRPRGTRCPRCPRSPSCRARPSATLDQSARQRSASAADLVAGGAGGDRRRLARDRLAGGRPGAGAAADDDGGDQANLTGQPARAPRPAGPRRRAARARRHDRRAAHHAWRRRSSAQRRFVANASHELRTPLTRIRTALDVAVGKPAPVPPQVIALDQKIREGLDRADRLMESLLVLGRAEYGELARPGADGPARASSTPPSPNRSGHRRQADHGRNRRGPDLR